MIYLDNIETAQSVYIPNNGVLESTGLKMRLYGATDNRWLEDIDVIDLKTFSQYHDVSLCLPDDLANGEYLYSLVNESNDVLSKGVLVIGGYQNRQVQYHDHEEYKQYRDE